MVSLYTYIVDLVRYGYYLLLMHNLANFYIFSTGSLTHGYFLVLHGLCINQVHDSTIAMKEGCASGQGQ